MNRLLTLPALLALALVARADVTSGPKAGDKVEDFQAFGVVGSIEGKEGSYVADPRRQGGRVDRAPVGQRDGRQEGGRGADGGEVSRPEFG
jgi:hypothetical protein